jgi:predicted acetyltransferase
LIVLITTNEGINTVSKIYTIFNTKEKNEFLKRLKEYVMKFTRNTIGFFFFSNLLHIEDSKYLKFFILSEFNKDLGKIICNFLGMQLFLKLINTYEQRSCLQMESKPQTTYFDAKLITSKDYDLQEVHYYEIFKPFGELISNFTYLMDLLYCDKYGHLVILHLVENLSKKTNFRNLKNHYNIQLQMLQREITETTYQLYV